MRKESRMDGESSERRHDERLAKGIGARKTNEL